MHRLNRIIALILTFLLILTVPISAAAGLDNFTVSKTFTLIIDNNAEMRVHIIIILYIILMVGWGYKNRI